jgi:type II restriction enzyme
MAITNTHGTLYKSLPDKHNQLESAIVNDFGPRYAPGAKVIYLAGVDGKILVFEKDIFASFGVKAADLGKLPDIVLYDEEKNRLFLVEAVTSHDTVSPKRRVEFEEMFKNSLTERIYVSAFQDFASCKRCLNDIAWETDVWVAEIPSHMIHFNGDKFLKPRI